MNWKISVVTLVLVAVILIPHSFGHSRDVVKVPASINPVKIDGIIDPGEWDDTTTITIKNPNNKDATIQLKYEWPNRTLVGAITVFDDTSEFQDEEFWIDFDTGHEGSTENDGNDISFFFDRTYGNHGVCTTIEDAETCTYYSDPPSPFSSLSSEIREIAGGWQIEFKIGFLSNPQTMGFRVLQEDTEFSSISYPSGAWMENPSTWADITFPLQGGAATVTTTSTRTVTTTSRTTITSTAYLTRTLTSTSATTLTRTMTSTSVTTVTSKLSAQTVTTTSIPPAKTTTVTSEVIEQVFSTRTVTSELYRANDINNDTAFINSEMALALAGVMIIVSIIAGLIIKRGK